MNCYDLIWLILTLQNVHDSQLVFVMIPRSYVLCFVYAALC